MGSESLTFRSTQNTLRGWPAFSFQRRVTRTYVIWQHELLVGELERSCAHESSGHLDESQFGGYREVLT